MLRLSGRRFPLVVVALLLSVRLSQAQTEARRTVNVDGHRIQIRAAGMQRSGQVPTVIFESAFRTPLDTWDPIFDKVATLGPALAYDRPGIGGSADDGELPTPRHIARKLHAILMIAGARPPYVLVGHSWGGLLIRMYAAEYPKEVAGIVYIDPTDVRPLEEEVTYYREQGYVGQAMLDRKEQLLRFRNPEKGEAKVLIDTIRRDFQDFRSLPSLPDVPMAVLMSAHFDPISWKDSPCAPRQCEDVLVRWRIHWLRAMMEGMSDATLTVATSVGHFMHSEEPTLVLSAIERVIIAASRRSGK